MKIDKIISNNLAKFKRNMQEIGYVLAAFLPAGLGCSIVFIPWILLASVLAFWTQSNINQFLVVAGKTTECPYFLAWIPSFIFMPVMFVLNIISEIVQLFL
jgi:hypothetical protein